MSKVIVVNDEQIDAARTLISIAGGAENVDPLIRKIADAQPRGDGRTSGSASGS